MKTLIRALVVLCVVVHAATSHAADKLTTHARTVAIETRTEVVSIALGATKAAVLEALPSQFWWRKVKKSEDGVDGLLFGSGEHGDLGVLLFKGDSLEQVTKLHAATDAHTLVGLIMKAVTAASGHISEPSALGRKKEALVLTDFDRSFLVTLFFPGAMIQVSGSEFGGPGAAVRETYWLDLGAGPRGIPEGMFQQREDD